METKLEQYAHGVFGVEDSGEGTEDEAAVPRRKATKGQWHPKINLPTLENGMPSISIILNMNLQEKKDVVRAFIVFIMVCPSHLQTNHTGKACGCSNISVPWATIALDHGKYISGHYWPTDVGFKEPLRLTNREDKNLGMVERQASDRSH